MDGDILMLMGILVVWSNDNLYDNLNHGTSMKKIIIVIVAALLASEIVQAQGTIYLSSLSSTSTGRPSVGSDSWLAAGFDTGNNADGYLLDSIALGMANAAGNPSDFTIMIYANKGGVSISPGSNLGTLTGSLSPVNAGTYTYTPDSSLILSPNTIYFIVLTAGTAVANGAYEWSESAYPPSINDWGAGNGVLNSNNGIPGWSPTPYLGIAQFAITATAIPEPSPAFLLLLGSVVLMYVRRIFHR